MKTDPQKAIALLNKSYSKATHLLKKEWRDRNRSSKISSTGFCYMAAEALFHMIGGTETSFRPYVFGYKNGDTHWWLSDGETVLDPTRSQYGKTNPPYKKGRKCGFMMGYEKMSKACADLISISLSD